MGSVTIRGAEVADRDAILNITERAWDATYSELLAGETIDSAIADFSAGDATRRLIERNDIAFFVAERSGAVVGYLCGVPSGSPAELDALYVDPDAWADGIGSALLGEFEAVCRDHGARAIEFTVLAGNEIGLSFYRGHGYRQIDERETYRFGDAISELVFRGPVE